MTAPLLLALVLVALYAVCKAARDVISFRWEGSRFYRWTNGRRTAYFGDGRHVYLRRYVGHTKSGGKRWMFRVPLLASLCEALWDGKHLFATVQLAAFLAGLTLAPALPLWSLPAGLAVFYIVFTLTYRVLR